MVLVEVTPQAIKVQGAFAVRGRASMRYTELQQNQWPLNDALEVIASHLHLSRNHKDAEEQLEHLECAIDLLTGMHRYQRFYD